MCPVSGQSVAEDSLNSATAGVGLLLALGALPVLVVAASRYGTVWHVVSFSIYGASLVLLYGVATLYHATRQVRRKRLLQVLDHASIYVLIAGTYTPFTFITLKGGWGWSLFGVVWGLSAVGIGLKAVFGDRFELISTLVYIAMGWLCLVAVVPLVHNLAWGGLALLFFGGVSYTAGTAFYLWERMPFNHAVWHLFVLTGSVCHFFAVLFFTLLAR
ncbi:MAG TPA: hemolysin III family protein [bacterium]|nr:hemolysin III family protein [bacterium]